MKYKPYKAIYNWFAWYPVLTINNGWMWLVTVERFTDNMYTYYYYKEPIES